MDFNDDEWEDTPELRESEPVKHAGDFSEQTDVVGAARQGVRSQELKEEGAHEGGGEGGKVWGVRRESEAGGLGEREGDGHDEGDIEETEGEGMVNDEEEEEDGEGVGNTEEDEEEVVGDEDRTRRKQEYATVQARVSKEKQTGRKRTDCSSKHDAADARNVKDSKVKLEAESIEERKPQGEVELDGEDLNLGSYCTRELNLLRMEEAGTLQFVCCRNDGYEQHMIWLVGLKNIFSRQLPNMPKEYIVRLVLDRTHKSMMTIKNGVVVGGITYRPYLKEKFGEIAFCAITATEQVRGFGTRLMNHLKSHARDVDGLKYFLTYADNNAVGYFMKQGFTSHISFSKDIWDGFIKDYDGGTLMQCELQDHLPYTRLPPLLKAQVTAVTAKIQSVTGGSHSLHVPPPFDKDQWGCPSRQPLHLSQFPGFNNKKRKAGVGMEHGEKRQKTQRMAGIALKQEDEEAKESKGDFELIDHLLPLPSSGANRVRIAPNALGPSLAHLSSGPPTQQQLDHIMRGLIKAMVDHVDSWPFREPVDANLVSDYYEIIKDPIDLKTMEMRVQSSEEHGRPFYITLHQFVADMRRMLANARIYNAPDTIYFKIANRLEIFFQNRLKAVLLGPHAHALAAASPGTPLMMSHSPS